MCDITNRASSDAALITIYPKECRLNRRAVRLLQMDKGYIKLAYDKDQARTGRTRVYVCHSDLPGYHGVAYSSQRRICDTKLCETLAGMLQGYGRYRICEEVYQDIGNTRYYEIFFKRYD